jgi:hypothetical protein
LVRVQVGEFLPGERAEAAPGFTGKPSARVLGFPIALAKIPDKCGVRDGRTITARQLRDSLGCRLPSPEHATANPCKPKSGQNSLWLKESAPSGLTATRNRRKHTFTRPNHPIALSTLYWPAALICPREGRRAAVSHKRRPTCVLWSQPMGPKRRNGLRRSLDVSPWDTCKSAHKRSARGYQRRLASMKKALVVSRRVRQDAPALKNC